MIHKTELDYGACGMIKIEEQPNRDLNITAYRGDISTTVSFPDTPEGWIEAQRIAVHLLKWAKL